MRMKYVRGMMPTIEQINETVARLEQHKGDLNVALTRLQRYNTGMCSQFEVTAYRKEPDLSEIKISTAMETRILNFAKAARRLQKVAERFSKDLHAFSVNYKSSEEEAVITAIQKTDLLYIEFTNFEIEFEELAFSLAIADTIALP